MTVPILSAELARFLTRLLVSCAVQLALLTVAVVVSIVLPISEIEWFNNHLPAPHYWCFKYRNVRGYHRDPVSWFKPSASQMIKHAQSLKRLVEEAGIPIQEVISYSPGEIVYEDEYQIVAHAFLSQKPRFR